MTCPVEAAGLVGGSEVPVDRALAPEAGVIDGAALAYAGHHVLQDAPFLAVVEHVAGDHGGDPRRPGQRRDAREPGLVVRPALQGEGAVGAVAEQVAQPVEFVGR
jgi:hypothetical protein